MNTPLDFEISLLAKNKGFDLTDKTKHQMYGNQNIHQLEKYDELKYYLYDDYVIALTIADAIMWLYTEHNIWIEVTFGKDCNNVWFDYDIFSLIKPRKDDELGEEGVEYEDDINEKWLDYETTYDSMMDERFIIMDKQNYPTPKEAYYAAIDHILKNLI